MPSAKFLLLASLSLLWGHLRPATAQAEPLQLCVRADRVVEGRPKEGAKIILRSQCKTRANGTPIEISIGDSDAIGGAEPCGSIEGVYTSGRESSSPRTVKISERNNSSSFKLEVLEDPTNLGSAVAFTCNDFRPALGQTYGAYCSFETLTGDPGPYFFSRLDCDSIAAVGYSFVEDTLRRVGEVCGDGIMDPSIGEQCDDGQASDVCDADCTLAVCGDGTLNGLAGEVCDDGGTSDGDGCSADCQSDETCGNGVTDLTVGEECDSGTTVGQGWCKADCTFSEEYDKITGLWQLNPVWGYWGGAHIVVLEGDTVLFSKRAGSSGGTTPGAPQCDRRYSMESSGLSYLDGDCGPLELLFSSSTTGRLGSSNLRQVVSCPGKSLEQIEAGECVPIPSPSGAFLDGMSRW